MVLPEPVVLLEPEPLVLPELPEPVLLLLLEPEPLVLLDPPDALELPELFEPLALLEPLALAVPLVPLELSVSPVLGGGGTNMTARISTAIFRRMARANCDFAISSRPLAVSRHDWFIAE